MDKLTYVSLNLCSSCVNMVSRNLRSLHWTEKRLCFSTNTKAYKSHLQSSTLLRMLPNFKKCNSELIEIPLSTKCAGNDSRQHTSVLNYAFCGQFRWPYLQQTYSVRYTAFDKRTAELLLRKNCFSGPSVRFYTTSSPGNQPPPIKSSKLNPGKSPVSWKSLMAVAGVGCLILFGMQYVKKEKEAEKNKSRSRLLGKAKLGGDWTLTDHYGNRRSSKEFHGQWLLIYFGFTHCPDVCPEEIEKIVNLISKTDANQKLPKIQPIIITVDPQRDTPEALKEYCEEFSPRLLGFTGSIEEIQQATHAYRVYFSPGSKDDDGDYIVDHSIISYLINPQGEFVDYFGQNKTVTEMYSSIQMHIYSFLRKQSEQATST